LGGSLRRLTLATVTIALGCTSDPGSRAVRLAARDPELARSLACAPGTWQRDGVALTSPGWRSAFAAPVEHLGARLPGRADGVLTVGIGQSPDYTLSLEPDGARAVAVEGAGGRAVYSRAFPATDVLFVADERRVEWLYLLADASAPLAFAFRVTQPKGLPKVTRERSGALAFADKNGRVRLRMPQPYAVDARGTRRDAALAFADGRLTVRLDARGLTYPLLLDPAIETAIWQQVPAAPSARDYTQLAYDTDRARTVLFGGSVGGEAGDTWDFDGTSWNQLTTTGNPPARAAGAMVYDSARKRMILFAGGNTAQGNLNDTWEYDGAAAVWTQVSTTGAPPVRQLQGMCFDSNVGRTVVFGGLDKGVLGDTWEYDGGSATWTQVVPTTAPTARAWSALVFDSARGRSVLYGGATGLGSGANKVLADTWEYDAAAHAWSQASPTSSPPPAWGFGMAFDEARSRTVLTTGEDASTAWLVGTWEYDGTTWAYVSPASQPGGRVQTSMVYERARGKMLLFGGKQRTVTARLGDTWEYAGATATWTQVPAVPAPPPRYDHAMAFDSGRARTVLFGGYDGNAPSNDTWEFDGTAWAQISTGSTNPSARFLAGMCYDAGRAKSVLFGGFDGTFVYAETWEYDGVAASWTLNKIAGPLYRYGPGLVYDGSRKKSVLFGGHDTSGYLNDTWEYDGTSWTQVATVNGPAARVYHAMAYDAKRTRTVLFGGYDGISDYGDTWEYTGAGWTKIAASVPPTARYGSAMAFDAARGRMVLFGGYAGSAPLADTWEYDGGWTQTAPASGPSARNHHAMVFDSARGRLVMFGGRGSGPFADTWEYHTRGGACSTGNECDSGFCVDGVCCEKAACGTCQACNLADPGNCTPVTNALDADSCAGACDATGACVPLAPPGTACSADALCQSGWCREATCCSTPCNGTCDSCAVTPGTCSTVTNGDDPDSCTGASSCDAQGACKLKIGRPCSDGTTCASGFCSDGVCCDSACDGGCDVCTQSLGALADGRCTVLAAGAPGSNPTCLPYLCAGQAACPTSCASDSACVAFAFCAATGTCRFQKAQGDACDPVANCQTPGCRVCSSAGGCQDGVCCDTTCGAACDVCSRSLGALVDGTCAPAPAGATGSPSCGAAACNGASATCPANSCTSDLLCEPGYYCAQNATCQPQKPQGGACNATQAGDCLVNGCRVCASAGGCVDGVCCDSACAGACQRCAPTVGACGPAPAGSAGRTSCAPYLCDGASSGCPTTCASDAACVSGFYCGVSGCTNSAKLDLGKPCHFDSQCLSAHCADGVCCDSACTGACHACNQSATLGTCSATPAGSDPQSRCAGDPGCGGVCGGSGACLFAAAGSRCDVCKACDGAGSCSQPATGSDDPACSIVACGGLSTECRIYSELTSGRCVSLGLCAAPNDPVTCTSFRDLPDGTMCSSGICAGGKCVPAPASAPPPGSGQGHGASGGCTVASPAPCSPTVPALLLALLGIARVVRRKTRCPRS
jgi:hypothetical protein